MGWFGKSKKEKEEEQEWIDIESAATDILKHNPIKPIKKQRKKKQKSKPKTRK
jgi:hypothetical protein